MENLDKKNGYYQKNISVKRYCQTMDLKDDPQLIDEYVKRHGELHHWVEIREGIRSVGILEMEIYRLGTKLFMIIETGSDFCWEEAMERLATLPRQAEWEQYMSIFQHTESTIASEKWILMDRIFYLYK